MDGGDDLRQALDRLVRLGRTPDVDIRPVLLRVLVDMFVRRAHHTPGELVQFEEMIGRLLDEADLDVRESVAERISSHPAAPRALVKRFLDEGGKVAAAALRHARLEPDDLPGAATWGTDAMAIAVATRGDLTPDVVASLADRPEAAVLHALATNALAPIGRETFRYLVRRARGDEVLGRILLVREGHPADRAPLFLLANAEQRSAILLAARREDFGPEMDRPRLSAEEAVALARVERTILSPDRDGFDVALADALGSRLDDIWRLIDDPRGEPLALALAAIGAPTELAARVFILSGPAIGHSVMAVRNLTALVESMPRRTAARLVSAMTHAALRVPRGSEPEPASRGRREEDGRSLARPRQRTGDEAGVDRRRARSG